MAFQGCTSLAVLQSGYTPQVAVILLCQGRYRLLWPPQALAAADEPAACLFAQANGLQFARRVANFLAWHPQILPNTVTDVGKSAFAKCHSLEAAPGLRDAWPEAFAD
jgi:hypothetical protein